MFRRRILEGRFYWRFDHSPRGIHPAYVYKKNDKKNQYNILCFTSNKGGQRIKLNKNINPRSNSNCYVLNKTFIARNSSFGGEMFGCKVTDPRDKATMKYIIRKENR